MNTISRGRLYEFRNEYSVYELYTSMGNRYFLAMPNTSITECSIYLGFPTKDVSSLAAYELKNEILNTYNMLYNINKSYLYLFCDLDYNLMQEAANDNDYPLYNKLLTLIHDITKDTFNVIKENNDITVNQTIKAIKQTDIDIKLIDWLEVKLNNYLEGIKINKIKKEYNKNNIEITFNNQEVKSEENKLVNAHSYGFTSISSIITVLLLSVVFGIFIAIILIK